MDPQPRRRPSARLVLAVVAGVAVALVLALTTRLFVWPDTDRPARADAIVLFAGGGDRKATALRLARAGYAPVLVVSTGVPLRYHCIAPVPGVETICFHPDPSTTQGEARYLAQIAEERHWHRIIVIVSTPQATRARLRVERCYHDQYLVVTAHVTPWRWALDVVYEWGALGKALLLQRGC